jgi:hypothetical protein
VGLGAGGSAAERARRLARAAWEAGRDGAFDALHDLVSPDRPGVLADRRLARAQQCQAQRAQREQARQEVAHRAAVGRRERVLRRSRQAVPRYGVVTGAAAAGSAVATVAGDAGAGALLAGVAGLGAMRLAVAVRRLWRPPPPPPPPPPVLVPPPVPPRGSVAFPAVRRLERVHSELRRLLPLVAPAGRGAAEEAWQAASEADLALRWQAARVAAVEPYRGSDPELLRGLQDGVAAQERLAAAVADLVAASADPLACARLQDATDVLHGLAQGLRELR